MKDQWYDFYRLTKKTPFQSKDMKKMSIDDAITLFENEVKLNIIKPFANNKKIGNSLLLLRDDVIELERLHERITRLELASSTLNLKHYSTLCHFFNGVLHGIAEGPNHIKTKWIRDFILQFRSIRPKTEIVFAGNCDRDVEPLLSACAMKKSLNTTEQTRFKRVLRSHVFNAMNVLSLYANRDINLIYLIGLAYYLYAEVEEQRTENRALSKSLEKWLKKTEEAGMGRKIGRKKKLYRMAYREYKKMNENNIEQTLFDLVDAFLYGTYRSTPNTDSKNLKGLFEYEKKPIITLKTFKSAEVDPFVHLLLFVFLKQERKQ